MVVVAPGKVVVGAVLVGNEGQVVGVTRVMVVLGAGTPLGRVRLIWLPRAVIAPTTTSTTSDIRIVYSRTDAPHSLSTST